MGRDLPPEIEAIRKSWFKHKEIESSSEDLREWFEFLTDRSTISEDLISAWWEIRDDIHEHVDNYYSEEINWYGENKPFTNRPVAVSEIIEALVKGENYRNTQILHTIFVFIIRMIYCIIAIHEFESLTLYIENSTEKLSDLEKRVHSLKLIAKRTDTNFRRFSENIASDFEYLSSEKKRELESFTSVQENREWYIRTSHTTRPYLSLQRYLFDQFERHIGRVPFKAIAALINYIWEKSAETQISPESVAKDYKRQQAKRS